MATRLRNCDETIVKGRLAKAEQFLDAAATVRDFADDEADVGDATIISGPLPRCRKWRRAENLVESARSR